MTWSRVLEEEDGIGIGVGSESGIGRKEEYSLGGTELFDEAVIGPDLRFDTLGILLGGVSVI